MKVVTERDAPVLRDSGWRADNAGRLMFAATDALVRDKLRVMRAGGAELASEALMALLLNLDREGTRLTALAQRAGQTKQSMIELVDKAAALGVIDRRPDPGDLRAKIVHLTPAGIGLLGLLEQGIRTAEERFTAIVGAAFIDRLKRELGSYAEVADADPEGTWRQHNAGRLLALAARRFARDLLRVVHQRGHREVTDVLLALFRNLDLAGTRLTDLAARARMTKQSMRELVDRAEALGLVERRPDPADRRAKTVLFTAAGLAMLDEVRRGVGEAEAQLAALVGDAFMRTLKRRLTDYLLVAERDVPAG